MAYLASTEESFAHASLNRAMDQEARDRDMKIPSYLHRIHNSIQSHPSCSKALSPPELPIGKLGSGRHVQYMYGHRGRATSRISIYWRLAKSRQAERYYSLVGYTAYTITPTPQLDSIWLQVPKQWYAGNKTF